MGPVITNKKYSACIEYYDPTKDYDKDKSEWVSEKLQITGICDMQAILELMQLFIKTHPNATSAEFFEPEKNKDLQLDSVKGLAQVFMLDIPVGLFTKVRVMLSSSLEKKDEPFSAEKLKINKA